jgi:opacity protein-like surface antigen
MSRFLGLACILLALAMPSFVHAADLPWHVGAEAAFSKPLSDWSDVSDNGSQFGAYGERVLNPNLALGVEVGRHQWAATDAFNFATSVLASIAIDPLFDPTTDALLVNATVKTAAVQYTGYLKYRFTTASEQLTPYLKVGVGGYRVKSTVDLAGIGSSDHHVAFFGFNVGGGADIKASDNVWVGADASYHFIPSKDDMGSDISALLVGVHVSYGFGTF